jgi:hypothetical protein
MGFGLNRQNYTNGLPHHTDLAIVMYDSIWELNSRFTIRSGLGKTSSQEKRKPLALRDQGGSAIAILLLFPK